MFWHNGEPEDTRGEPPFLSIMRATKWYADWLLNRVVLNRFRTAHVLFKKVKGTPSQATSVSSSSPDSTKSGLGGKLEKRLPKPGTIVTHNESIEYEWKSPDLGAGDAETDGRAILKYALAGSQAPEFLIGDASTANYSSLLVAGNPFVRQVEFYQDMFTGIFRAVFAHVIEHGIKTGKLKKTSTETVLVESRLRNGVRRVLRALGLREDLAGDGTAKKPIPTKTEVDIMWPSLIHSDQMEEAQTLQLHQSMGIVSNETTQQKLNYDHEVEEARMAAERVDQDKYSSNRDEEIVPKKDESDTDRDGESGGGSSGE
jgi:hypothetical protein